jgi:cytochrome b561
MGLRNGAHGYGLVTKALHWSTALLLTAQFGIGLTMDVDGAADAADQRLDAFAERGERLAKAEGKAAEERFEAALERREAAMDAMEDAPGSAALADVVTGSVLGRRISAVEAHVSVGLLLLAVGLVRLLWRRATPLPPWAAHLSSAERRFESRLERTLLTLLLVVPTTGVALALGGDDLLPLHVSAQVALVATVALHAGLVLKHTVVRPNEHLSRML